MCADSTAFAVVVIDFDPFFLSYDGAVWAVDPADQAVDAFFLVNNRFEGAPITRLVLE